MPNLNNFTQDIVILAGNILIGRNALLSDDQAAPAPRAPHDDGDRTRQGAPGKADGTAAVFKVNAGLTDCKGDAKMGGRGRNSERFYLDLGNQGKHVPGHNNYREGKSIITVSEERLTALFNAYRGTGQFHGDREVIDFGEVIGLYIDGETGEAVETTRGTIHYKKDGGWHIVPAKPRKEGEYYDK